MAHAALNRAALALIAGSALGVSHAAGGEPIDFSPVFDPIADYVASDPGVDGAGILIRRFDGETLGVAFFGAFDAQTVVPIASATKLVTGSLIAALAGDGVIDLDAPVGDTLPEFEPFPFKRTITVRQAFSHTSGFPAQTDPVPFDWRDRTITLADSVEGIATQIPLGTIPGGAFAYGGISMQVAGRVAEVGAGVPFEDLLQQRLLDPLGIGDADFDGLGETTNPRVAGGLQTSLGSYARLLRMLANDGRFGGTQVIAPEAIDELFADQTGGAAPIFVPPTLESFEGYGLGNWVLRRDGFGEPVEFGSPGAFGTYPWIDFEHGYYGVFVVDSLLREVDTLVDDVRAFTRDALGAEAPCSIADLSEPFGVLDLTDINAFVDAVVGGTAAADLDENGVIDLSDIVIFVAAFEAGCPA